jgi:HlyD family secretion protein
MKKSLRLALTLLVIGGAIAGGYWYYSNQVSARATASKTNSTGYTQVVTVTRGSLNSTITVVGSMEAVQSADLAFTHLSSTTKLASLAVKAGNTITTGQVLASVDPTAYQQALDEAKSQLAADEKKLTDLKTPATELEIAQAELKISQAKYDLQAAQDTLDSLLNPDIANLQQAVADAQSALAKAQANVVSSQETSSSKDQLARLLTAEATPAADYNRLSTETYSDAYYQDRLQVAYNKMMNAQDARVTFQVQQEINALQAQMDVRKDEKALADAQTALAKGQAGGDPVALAKAQVAVQDAQVALQVAEKVRTDLDAGSDATDIATAQAAVDKDALAVSDAQAALDGSNILAPFNGTVLKTDVNAGDLVSDNTAVMSVANLKSLQVAASIDETTIRKVAAGQTARITFDAFPGQTFTGTVQSVPLQGTLQGGVTVYSVPISLNGADKVALRVGMTANVKIQSDQVKDVLLVPTLALQLSNGKYSVLVPNISDPNGAPRTVSVEIGLSDGTYTQITSGLEEGNKVLAQMGTTSSTTTNSNQGGPGGGPGGMDMGGPPPGQ